MFEGKDVRLTGAGAGAGAGGGMETSATPVST